MKLHLLWGLLLGLFFTIATQASFWVLSAPQPYKDVVVTELERTDEGYVVHANFIKTACTFKRLEVFGINTGIPVYLEWKAQDGSPATDYDRSIGKQHLIILVITTESDYDTLEIRTRHDCNGQLVDKVFATIQT
jgi:hypothetical protein